MSSPSVLSLILLLAGGWLVWWGLSRRAAASALPDGWRRVPGTVIDTGDGVAAPPRIEYRTPDGRRLRVPGPMSTPFTVGQQIEVMIDPTDPTRARLEITEREAVRLVGLLVGVGAVLLVLGGVTAIAFL